MTSPKIVCLGEALVDRLGPLGGDPSFDKHTSLTVYLNLCVLCFVLIFSFFDRFSLYSLSLYSLLTLLADKSAAFEI